ncbi:hypothetical protein AWZ03_011260 [Drosophila navojoa]|uniref:Par3/HAL N-terminal domain-containing protein n=1 Tax=Drosophila navojoa TaxID=7232 RepID=A0A484B0L6_DRONA|nr:hypothetical protein AWZ03_011260 [Drosophila navojoa]
MKVTVCFGDVRILVPCGTGELLVRDLISEATRRYKKAAGKTRTGTTRCNAQGGGSGRGSGGGSGSRAHMKKNKTNGIGF